MCPQKATEPASTTLFDEEDSASPTVNGSKGAQQPLRQFFLFDFLSNTDFNVGLDADRVRDRIAARLHLCSAKPPTNKEGRITWLT